MESMTCSNRPMHERGPQTNGAYSIRSVLATYTPVCPCPAGTHYYREYTRHRRYRNGNSVPRNSRPPTDSGFHYVDGWVHPRRGQLPVLLNRPGSAATHLSRLDDALASLRPVRPRHWRLSHHGLLQHPLRSVGRKLSIYHRHEGDLAPPEFVGPNTHVMLLPASVHGSFEIRSGNKLGYSLGRNS